MPYQSRHRATSVILCLVYFLFVIVWVSCISTSAIDCLKRLVSEMTYYVSSGTLTLHTHSLTYRRESFYRAAQNTLMHNSKFSFECRLLRCDNMLVSCVLACQLTDNQLAVNTVSSASFAVLSVRVCLFFCLLCCLNKINNK